MVNFNSESLQKNVRAQVAFFRPAFLADWLVPFILTLISHRIESVYPFERTVTKFVLADPSLSHLHTLQERCPGPLLDQLSYYLPLAFFLVIGLYRQSLQEIHHSVLALVGSRALMRIVVESVKNRAGRCNYIPSFVDAC